MLTRQNQLLFDTLGGQQYRDIIIVDDIEGFRKNKNELLTQMRKS